MNNRKNLEELEKEYELELNKAAEKIIKEKAKKILIQLPDGFKKNATEIVDEIERLLNLKKYKTEIFIWFGSCYGACDLPMNEAKEAKIDLIIQFGHSAWNYKRKDINIIN